MLKMKFKLEIKSESNPEGDTKMFLDEEAAIDESIRKRCIVAYA
tara:strand:- start:13563 stop:13694 length:132 start_codon:yes stop_codon:yes gene_type:complete